MLVTTRSLLVVQIEHYIATKIATDNDVLVTAGLCHALYRQS